MVFQTNASALSCGVLAPGVSEMRSSNIPKIRQSSKLRPRRRYSREETSRPATRPTLSEPSLSMRAPGPP